MRLPRGIIAILLMIASQVCAEPRVRLPLDGYFRAGRCMPVLVESSESAFRMSANRAIPTNISAGRAGIVPMLLLDETKILHVNNSEIELHPLMPTERLVAVTGDDEDFAARIFPNQTIIKIHIDSAQLTPSLAWQSLDAAILDKNLNESLLSNLLGAGTTIAIKSNDRPDSSWPWKQLGAYWILQPGPAGPGDSIGGDAAYLPTQSWQPNQPATLERRIVLISILICLLTISPLLMRSRWSIAAMIAITLLSGGAIEIWRQHQSPLRTVSGEIIVASNQLTQNDTWKYFTSSRRASGELASTWRPIVLDANHAQNVDLKLQCNADGSDVWQFKLTGDAPLAFLSRTFSPTILTKRIDATSRSPLYEMARESYLGPNMRIVGEIRSDESWPAVVVRRD